MNDLREVDLERGMPRAEQAIRQMLFELRRSPGLGCSAVKLIHGYGSRRRLASTRMRPPAPEEP